jgi:hypothetical protein
MRKVGAFITGAEPGSSVLPLISSGIGEICPKHSVLFSRILSRSLLQPERRLLGLEGCVFSPCCLQLSTSPRFDRFCSPCVPLGQKFWFAFPGELLISVFIIAPLCVFTALIV